MKIEVDLTALWREKALKEIMESFPAPWKVFETCFMYMSESEAMLRRAFPGKEGQPRKEVEPRGLFLATKPTPLFPMGVSMKVYRHHVRELIERSKTKEPDYEPATKAEVLLAILRTSEKAPLANAGQLLAETLFLEVFGTNKALKKVRARPDYKGEFEEMLADARRRIPPRSKLLE